MIRWKRAKFDLYLCSCCVIFCLFFLVSFFFFWLNSSPIIESKDVYLLSKVERRVVNIGSESERIKYEVLLTENGKDKTVSVDKQSYDSLVSLSFDPSDLFPEDVYVTYTKEKGFNQISKNKVKIKSRIDIASENLVRSYWIFVLVVLSLVCGLVLSSVAVSDSAVKKERKEMTDV